MQISSDKNCAGVNHIILPSRHSDFIFPQFQRRLLERSIAFGGFLKRASRYVTLKSRCNSATPLKNRSPSQNWKLAIYFPKKSTSFDMRTLFPGLLTGFEWLRMVQKEKLSPKKLEFGIPLCTQIFRAIFATGFFKMARAGIKKTTRCPWII